MINADELDKMLELDKPPKKAEITDDALLKLFMRCKGLSAERERDRAFSSATLENLRLAYDKLEEMAKSLSKTRDELEIKVKELKERIKEVEDYNKLIIGRELKMIDMESEINKLCGELGRPPKYKNTLPPLTPQ